MRTEIFPFSIVPVADLGEGPGPPPPPPLFWVKKEEMTEGKMANRASKSRPGPPLAQGLDPPLSVQLINERKDE